MDWYYILSILWPLIAIVSFVLVYFALMIPVQWYLRRQHLKKWNALSEAQKRASNEYWRQQGLLK